MKPTPKPLTLGNIAKYCHVDRVTVQRWVKTVLVTTSKPILPAYRTPGGHYRVTKEDFRRFLQKNDMPVYPEFFQDVPQRILVADAPEEDAKSLANSLRSESSADYDIQVCTSGREALLAMGQFKPDLAVLNIEIDDMGGATVCGDIKRMMPNGHLKILALVESDPYDQEAIMAAGADSCLKKPVDAEELLNTVSGMMEVSMKE